MHDANQIEIPFFSDWFVKINLDQLIFRCRITRTYSAVWLDCPDFLSDLVSLLFVYHNILMKFSFETGLRFKGKDVQ